MRENKVGGIDGELPENKERRTDNEKFKHKQKKPSGFETLCHEDPSCPVNCNVCCMLPYHTKTGIFLQYKWQAFTVTFVELRGVPAHKM